VNERPALSSLDPDAVPEKPVTQPAKPCPFCNPLPERIVIRGVAAMALWDSYPLNPGHVLIVPRRHVAS